MYQQIRLSDLGLVGAPGPLPANLVGLSDAVLADLSAAIAPAPPGLDGRGFWPVVVVTPAYNTARQVAVPPATFAADPKTRIVTGTATVRDMTAEEYAAANPPATVSGNQWAFALADLGLSGFWEAGIAKSKPKDRIRVGLIARDTPLLAADPLLVRVAANAGTDSAGAPLIDVATVHARARDMPT